MKDCYKSVVLNVYTDDIAVYLGLRDSGIAWPWGYVRGRDSDWPSRWTVPTEGTADIDSLLWAHNERFVTRSEHGGIAWDYEPMESLDDVRLCIYAYSSGLIADSKTTVMLVREFDHYDLILEARPFRKLDVYINVHRGDVQMARKHYEEEVQHDCAILTQECLKRGLPLPSTLHRHRMPWSTGT